MDDANTKKKILEILKEKKNNYSDSSVIIKKEKLDCQHGAHKNIFLIFKCSQQK